MYTTLIEVHVRQSFLWSAGSYFIGCYAHRYALTQCPCDVVAIESYDSGCTAPFIILRFGTLVPLELNKVANGIVAF